MKRLGLGLIILGPVVGVVTAAVVIAPLATIAAFALGIAMTGFLAIAYALGSVLLSLNVDGDDIPPPPPPPDRG